MNRNNTSSYFPLKMLNKNAADGVLFGPTTAPNERDGVYPDRVLKQGATVIWVPSAKKTVCIASYYDAQAGNDAAALKTFKECGIPLGIDFGVGRDLTSTYVVKKRRESKPRAPAVKVMRAKYAARFEDGSAFKAGDVVKIVFRKKFVSDAGGSKRFQNAYERPTSEEREAFLKSEANME